MLKGQRPQRHMRFIGGKAVVVNADVCAQKNDVSALKGVPSGVTAALAFSDPEPVVVHQAFTKISPFHSEIAESLGVWEIVTELDERGCGVVKVRGDGVSTSRSVVTAVGEGASLGHEFLAGVDYSNAFLANGEATGFRAVDLRFDRANLDGFSFTALPPAGPGDAVMKDCSFVGASMRGGSISKFSMSCVDMREVDFAGFQFRDCDFCGDGPYAIDVRGSNFDPSCLCADDPTFLREEDYFHCLHRVKYERFSLGEASDILDVPTDELALHVWAGDIDVLDNDTLEVVSGVYQEGRHHIPEWEVRKLGSITQNAN